VSGKDVKTPFGVAMEGFNLAVCPIGLFSFGREDKKEIDLTGSLRGAKPLSRKKIPPPPW